MANFRVLYKKINDAMHFVVCWKMFNESCHSGESSLHYFIDNIHSLSFIVLRLVISHYLAATTTTAGM